MIKALRTTAAFKASGFRALECGFQRFFAFLLASAPLERTRRDGFERV